MAALGDACDPQPVRAVGGIEGNLYLLPDQFDAFEAQCRRVDAEAEEIAEELGWREQGAASIRGYMANVLEAVKFARARGSDSITIW